jgi:hypothetical protein
MDIPTDIDLRVAVSLSGLFLSRFLQPRSGLLLWPDWSSGNRI